MKNKFLILFVISAFFILGTAQTAQASVVGNPPLRIGSTGSDVVQLQTKLNSIGYQVGPADGIFGWKTQSGVIAFQKANSLTADGIVGPITAGTLNNAYSLLRIGLDGLRCRATAEQTQYNGIQRRPGGRRLWRQNTVGSHCVPKVLWADRRRHRRTGHGKGSGECVLQWKSGRHRRHGKKIHRGSLSVRRNISGHGL